MRSIDWRWNKATRRRLRHAGLPPDFVEAEYLRVNPDVAHAVKKGLIRSGAEHWLASGASEGRRLRASDGHALPADFDEEAYLVANPDVRIAVQSGLFPDGASHWLAVGHKDSRHFKPSSVAEQNDQRQANREWDAFVSSEGVAPFPGWRPASGASDPDGFDVEAYAANNRDVKEDWHGHWLRHGFFEGRTPFGSRLYSSRKFGPEYWQKSDGVSFFGLLDANTGLGESARGYLKALETTGIPVTAHTLVERQGRFEQPKRPLSPSDSKSNESKNLKSNATKINIFHINADMTHRWFLDGRRDLLDNSFNIGIWFWELLHFRPDWMSAFGAFDEIWVASDFVRRSIASLAPIPVVKMPMVVSQDKKAGGLPRSYFRIPDDVFTFGCIFDAGSVTARKNPAATVRAFKRAFGERTDVLLLVKYHGAHHYPESVAELHRLAESSANIRFYGRVFDEREIRSFKSAIDCLVSSHRSEGFGLNIAEAMLAGKPVIATGYSGNMEFMTAENSHLIDFTLREVGENYGPYMADALWAEPDVDDLAARMRSVFEERDATAAKAEIAQGDIATKHGVETVARSIGERFETLELLSPMPRFPQFFESWGRGIGARAEFYPAAGPRISIIVPVYNIEGRLLHHCVRSVLRQTYARWELILHDDGSSNAETLWYLDKLRGSDPRIKVSLGATNQGIAEASNEAVALSSGEFIALLDNDDELTPDALSEVVAAILGNPTADLIYSDEDKIRGNGEYGDHYFKPDWSPEHLESVMYLLHLMVIRRSLFLEIGGFRDKFSGAQDYDLALRASRTARKVLHVPKVLYHWRMIEGSAAATVDAKPEALRRSALALQDHITAQGRKGTVVEGLTAGLHRLKEALADSAKVTLLIFTDNRRADVPQRGNINLLDHFLASIVKTTRTKLSFKTLVIDNNNLAAGQRASIEKAGGRVVSYAGSTTPFNFSDKANFGLSLVDTEFVIILNDDMEVISPDWIDALISIAQRPKIGVVGARLLFADDRIQHCGVVVGVNNGCAHVYHGYDAASIGYNGYTHIVRNYLAVTGACAAFRMSLFDEIGGFDREFRVDYNDIDFCLRAYEAGYRNVYTPFASLYHFEGTTSARSAPREDQREAFVRKWKKYMDNDPYFNPNLSRTSIHYEALPHFGYR